MSPAFVDDVARFGGSASQVARLRSESFAGGNNGPKAPPSDHVPPPTGRFRTWDRFLLWLAGVNYELASRSYVDRTRHATIGFAVLVTALTAGASFFLVLSSSGVNTPLS